MTSKAPPVPPANRSPKGPGEADHGLPEPGTGALPPKIPEKTGQAGNTHVNTTNQGHQQDR